MLQRTLGRLSLMFVTLASLAGPAAAQQPAYTIAPDHPRIYIRPADLPRLRAKCGVPGFENVPGVTFGEYATEFAQIQTAARGRRQGAGTAAAFVHLMLGPADTEFLNIAKLEIQYNDDVERIDSPITFDWIYNDLTPAERAAHATGFITHRSYALDIRKEQPFRARPYLWTVNVTQQIDFALYDIPELTVAQRDMVRQSMDSLVSWYKDFVIPLDASESLDGVHPEGMGYFGDRFNKMETLATFLEMWRTAAGENLWPQEELLRGHGLWSMHAWNPATNKWAAADDVRALPGAINGRTGFLVANRYQDPLLQWVHHKMERLGGFWRDFGNTWKWTLILWEDRSLAAVDPATLGTARHLRGKGNVYMHSDWDDITRTTDARGDATFAFIKAGDNYVGHQNVDQGTFVIHKGEQLALDSGVKYGEPHIWGYSARTIAHNGLLIYDPLEAWNTYGQRFGSDTNTNDGGQIAAGYDPDFWTNFAPTGLEAGHILAFDHNADAYTYTRADITAAYQSTVQTFGGNRPKVDVVQREFVYLRSPDSHSDYFVIADRVSKMDPTFKTQFLLHAQEEPTMSGAITASLPLEGATEYAGRDAQISTLGATLHSRTLLPAGAILRKRGGPGFDWWVDGKNPLPSVPEDVNNALFKDWALPYGHWRIEVEAAQNQLDHFFLHVLHPTTQGTPPAESTVVATTGGAMQGAHLATAGRNRVVLFSTDRAGASPVGSLTYSLTPTTAEVEHLLVNLAPGTRYTVGLSSVGGTLTATLTPGAGGSAVVDAEGALRFVSNGAAIPVNLPPRVASTLALPATRVVLGQEVQLEATAGDPDGTVASYVWTFGDGTTGTGPIVRHAYAAEALYPVTLTVTDEDGATATTTVNVKVSATSTNVMPTVSASVTPTGGSTGQILTFAATATDPDGNVVSYAWDFGDGTTGSGATATHVYSEAGTYAVQITVMDNEGGFAVGSLTVPVAEALAVAPAAITLAINNTQTFTGFGGSPPYTYSVLGDGTIDPATGFYTAPATPGTATVQVTDAVGSLATANVTILQNLPLSITPQSTTVVVGGTVDFLVVGGVSPYTFALTSGAGTLAGTTYTAPGAPGAATLQVTDAEGTIRSASITIVEIAARLWLKADAIAGLADGAALATWPDSSGNGFGATQGTATNRPTFRANGLNGLPVVHFDGQDDWMRAPFVPAAGSAPRTLMVVVTNAQDNGGDGYRNVLHYGSMSFHQAYGLAWRGYAPQTGTWNSGNHYWQGGFAGTAAPAATPTILAITYDGTTDWLYVNGQASGSNVVALDTGGSFSLTIGSRLDGSPGRFLGDVAEVLAYDAALSDAGRQAVECYLAQKYGIPGVGACAAPGGGGGGNLPPTVTAAANPASAAVGQAVAFSATASDPDGTVVSYAWAFGDGATGTGATASHAYAAAGTYTASVTATDDGNASTVANVLVTIANPNQPPTVAVTATPPTVAAGDSVQFQGTATDPDGTIASYDWAFGDGTTVTTLAGNTSHAYGAAGTYTVTLTVTDNQGATASATVTVTVTGLNQAPSVTVTATPTAALTGETVQFQATASDSDGSIASYDWALGDGTTVMTPAGNTSHAYAAAGTYTATVTVTDDQGATASASVTVTVTAPVQNQPPVVTASATPAQAMVGDLVTFTATASDPDGTVVSQSWTFGDGVFATASASTATHAYISPGTFIAIVTVTDDAGATARAGVQVTISVDGDPPATGVTVTPDVPSPQAGGTVVTLTAQGTGGTGLYEYQYWRRLASGSPWTLVRDYSSAPYAWNTVGLADTYYFAIYVRNIGSPAGFEAWTDLTYTVTPGVPAASGVTVTPDLPSPQSEGTVVTLTAQGAGGSGTYEYQYWLRLASGGSWSLVRDYGSAPYAWDTTGLGETYEFAVYVRNVGSSAGFEAWTNLIYTVSDGPAQSVSVTADLPSPQPAGTVVTLTATGTGGTGVYEYQYWRRLASGGPWAMARDYASTPYAWDTTGLGDTYFFAVYVRNVGSSTGFEAWTSLTFAITGAVVAPTGEISATPTTVAVGEATVLDASSLAPSGSGASYDWDMGDGTATTSTSPAVAHAYAAAGTYVVTVTVTDSQGTVTLGNVGVTALASQPGCTLQMLSPNGGETLVPGTVATISWTGNTLQGGDVRLVLTADGQFIRMIRDLLPNTGLYDWTVPADLPAGGNYRVLLHERVVDRQCYDFSDAPFTIGNPAQSGLQAPGGVQATD